MEEIILPDILTFEWDEGNSTKSWIKHKVSTDEQEQAFFTKKKLLLKIKSIPNRRNDSLCIAKQVKEED